MKISEKPRALQWISDQYDKGNIAFNHPLQREINQWAPSTKSFLIHSLICGWHIDPILLVEENNILYPIDGAQRTSVSLDYINNKFALSKDTPKAKIVIVENGVSTVQQFEIAGKKFKKLDEIVQKL